MGNAVFDRGAGVGWVCLEIRDRRAKRGFWLWMDVSIGRGGDCGFGWDLKATESDMEPT